MQEAQKAQHYKHTYEYKYAVCQVIPVVVDQSWQYLPCSLPEYGPQTCRLR